MALLAPGQTLLPRETIHFLVADVQGFIAPEQTNVRPNASRSRLGQPLHNLPGNGTEDGVQQSDLSKVPLKCLAGLQHQ